MEASSADTHSTRKSHAVISLFRGDQTSTKSNSKAQDKHVQVRLLLVHHGANAAPAAKSDKDEKAGESLMHPPPSMAAAIAAERRLKKQSSSNS